MILKRTFLAALTVFVTLSCYAGGGQTNAQFSISATSVNAGKIVTFTDESTRGNCGSIAGWVWNFGEGASPATADTQGPHEVYYSTPGIKSISLNVAGTGNGCRTDFTLKPLTVLDAPIPTMSQWSIFILGLLITSIAVGRIWMTIKVQA